MMNMKIDCSFSGLETLVREALEYMEKQKYSLSWMDRHRRAWRQFVDFVADGSEKDGSFSDLVRAFLAIRGIEDDVDGMALRAGQCTLRLAMRSLTDYALHGCFPRRKHLVARVQLPSEFESVILGYVQHLEANAGLAERSVESRRKLATLFCHYLDAAGVASMTEMQVRNLPGFVASRSYLRQNSLAHELSMLRGFLRYLCMVGIVSAEIIEEVPRVRVRRHARIPSVWSRDQVGALLGAVDRSSPKGKRDYAILLLAARLGMRASDIRTLRLEDIRWDKAQVVYRQTKTGNPHSLPLTEETGQALIDYLRHGRPQTDHREVFLTAHAPIKPFARHALYHIITDWRLRAGIELTPSCRRGLHSLRHTVATRLLEAGTPLDIIADAMGHLSAETTREYTKVDIEALRSAAIDPAEVGNE